MEELFRKLGIDSTQGMETVVAQLKQKQVEYLERLDNAQDEKRKEQLSGELKEIETAIASFSWMLKGSQSGISRDSEGLEELKGSEGKLEELKGSKGEQEPENKFVAPSVSAAELEKLERRLDEILALLATPEYEKGIEQLKELAEGGYAVAQKKLGDMYDAGNRVPKDAGKVAEWYRKAAEQGDAGAQFNLGLMYSNGEGVAQDYAKAAEWYQKAAGQGDAASQFNLGVMYYDGKGVAQDYAKAVAWYQRAAKQGIAEAQFNLGVMYSNGEGVTKNKWKAVEWFQKAAEQGLADAQFNLGISYYNGDGVVRDYEKAAEWYWKAAEQGHAAAQNYLGEMYANDIGVAQNNGKAMEWYKKAAEQGNVDALVNLGELYKNALKDYEKAEECYLKAAGMGKTNMLGRMGSMCAEVAYNDLLNNTERSAEWYEKAAEWYLKAVEQGETFSEYSLYDVAKHLGNFVTKHKEYFMAVDESEKKVLELFRISAEMGYDWSQVEMGKMYRKGEYGVAVDYGKAMEWFQKAAEQGHGEAVVQIAEMYEYGNGVEIDYEKARKWYQRAEDMGYKRDGYIYSSLYGFEARMRERNQKKAEEEKKQDKSGNMKTMVAMAVLLVLRVWFGAASPLLQIGGIGIGLTALPTAAACMLFGPVKGVIFEAVAYPLSLYFWGVKLLFSGNLAERNRCRGDLRNRFS